MQPNGSSLGGETNGDIFSKCFDAYQTFIIPDFPFLPAVDTEEIARIYSKPQPLCMGKFVPQDPESVSAQQQDSAYIRRLATEKVLPLAPGSGDGKKRVRYTMCQKMDYPNSFPEYLFFPTVNFRKKSDTLRSILRKSLKSTWISPIESTDLRIADVQMDNADKLCFYKFGPGVVAFRGVVTTFHAGGLRHTEGHDWNIFWGKRIGPEEWKRASVYQRVNHFPGSKNIGRKDSLHWNIQKARKEFPGDYNFLPPTFVLPHETLAFQKYRLRHSEDDLTFIIKPVASSCGKGIYLTNSISLPWKQKPAIVQQYIPNPLLIHKRKFDFRIYVVLTKVHPLSLYVFDEGLVRIAPEEYPGNSDELSNIHKHVTNYSINKNCTPSEDAEIKWNLARFKKWLFETESDASEKWAGIQNSIEQIVVKTFAAIVPEITRQGAAYMPHDARMQGCFELFGFDLLLDQRYHMSLLEVNIMPSLATESDIDIDVKCKLLSELLVLVGIPAYDRALLTGTEPLEGLVSLSAVEKLIAEVLENDDFGRIFARQEGKTLLEVIMQSRDEYQRRGGFRRVFPTRDSYRLYGHLFDNRPDLTHFMMCWEEKYGVV